jgi:Fe-S oxidoreductase
MNWLQGEPVKLLPAEKAEVVHFMGCTASYEPELFPMARALMRLWRHLGVDVGLLQDEVCCADPIARLGDEALFEMLAEENRERFLATGAKSIVTTSPHCMNAFRKQYNGLPETLQIMHYTELLETLMTQEKPEFQKTLSYTVTYHDPCYLSKHNEITEPPRNVITMLPGVSIVEMKDHHMDSLCCGAGGGRMYAEVEETDRLANIRVRQALDTGANVLATACPYCHVMLMNAVRDLKVEEKIKVKDVAELVAEAFGIEGQ